MSLALAAPATVRASQVTAFAAKPSILSSAGGEVQFSAQVPIGASCTLLVAPSYGGLPSPFACGPGLSWPYVVVPPNQSAATDTYTYSVVASPGFGPPLTAGGLKIKVLPAPADTYVALGDSYSAGEGNPGKPPHEWLDRAGKPTEVHNGCDRSSAAYPVRVAKWLGSSATQSTLGLPTLSLRFLACSGATTEDLWPSGAAQLPLPGLAPKNNVEWQQMEDTADLANARIVTVTVGGNDLDFSDILTNCTAPNHDCSSASNDGWIKDLEDNISKLEPVLVDTYLEIQKAAPHAKVFVVGYPDLFPPNPSPQQLTDCEWATKTPIGWIAPQGTKYLAEQEQNLARMIARAASAAHVTFVDPNIGQYSFIGHDVCAGKAAWFNKPDPTHVAYSYHPNKAGQIALAEQVKQAIAATAPRWRTETLPLPAGADPASSVSMRGVSCASPSFCVAAGWFTEPGTTSVAHPLLDMWNGSGWTSQASPAGVSTLTSVSCGSASLCVALGESVLSNNSKTDVSLTWNGSAWTLHPLPTPPNSGPGFVLSSVSCSLSGPCEAVGEGSANSAPTNVPVAEQWNGSTWNPQAAATPSENSWLYGVSCAAGTSCMAVGQQAKPFSWEPLAEKWDGSTWTQVPTASVSSGFGALTSVACEATTSCVAVGMRGYGVEGEPRCSISETWGSSGWTLRVPPECAGPSDNVSCWASSGCLSFEGANAYEWNGSSWITEVTGLPSSPSSTYTSCPAATFCVATGLALGNKVYVRR